MFVPAQDLPDVFHAAFGQRMRELWEAPGGQGEQDWLELEPALLELLRAPTFRGALASILGPDYQVAAPWCNKAGQGGMIGLHVTGADTFGSDQGFHKDGTDHGNTQSTVRDLRNRQSIMMYYPLGASLAQGPTAVRTGRRGRGAPACFAAARLWPHTAAVSWCRSAGAARRVPAGAR